MSNYSCPRTHNKSNMSGRNEVKPISFSRGSFQIHHYSNSIHSPSLDGSPRQNFSQKYSFGSINSSNSSYDRSRDPSSVEQQLMREKSQALLKRKSSPMPKSSGLLYSTHTNKELSSIDKINDPSSNALICAGKAHLGYYKFSSNDNNKITLVHEFTQGFSSGSSQLNSLNPNLNKRRRQIKLSTIADVKSGFQKYNNYIAVCNNSTIISIYDINKNDNIDNPLVTSFSEHSRAVNSFDFNMTQTSLLISGGQDGQIKIWDLRSNSLSGSNKPDLNINAASDSIRDVKWMPGYNFSSFNQSYDGKQTGNSEYKFASIHDSGLLLKFDIRQPNQVEKKINAHTGPGLCLNWHPNQDYIATGGRDGKCCIWYIGDVVNDAPVTSLGSMTPNTLHTSNVNYYQSNATSLALPEMTINTGFPVTKLKFRPAYEKNVMDSLLAISSMGEEAEVNIYSLCRKFIPKHVLLTTSPSQGLVWWDKSLIFNTDRSNRINGWDIDLEPTVLDNLPKALATWRDIDGNGLLVIDQDSGTYTANEEYIPLVFDKRRRQSHRLLNPSINDNNSITKTKYLDSIKKANSNTIISPTSVEKTGNIKQPNLHSNKSIIGMTSPMYMTQFMPPTNSPSPLNEPLEFKGIQSPLIVALDFPHILNNMRLSKITSKKHLSKSSDIAAIKESPIQVFQYLARELEFSFSKDRKLDSRSSIIKRKSISDDSGSQVDVIKKIGFTDTTKWTNLINRKTDGEIAEKSSDRISALSTSSESIKNDIDEKSEHSKNNAYLNLEKKLSHGTHGMPEDAIEAQHKVDILIELVTICSHNASVYSYIDDVPNFKIWTLIKDSLLWDLKDITGIEEAINSNDSIEIKDKFQYFENLDHERALKNSSSQTQFSDIPSEIESFVTENPEALTSASLELDNDIEEGTKESKRPISNLQQQLKAENTAVMDTPSDVFVTATTDGGHFRDNSKVTRDENKIETNDNTNLLNIGKVNTENAIKIDSESVIEDVAPGSKSIEIPTLTRGRTRTSFIDTFMTNPLHNMERPDRSLLLAQDSAASLNDQSSPISKVSSIKSSSNVPHSLNSMIKLSQGKMHSRTRSIGKSPIKLSGFLSPKERSLSLPLENILKKNKSAEKVAHNDQFRPPWETGKLLKQLFNQAVETGNILLAINIITLFQDLYNITTIDVVKSSLLQFVEILHRYELFEIATALLKYCSWNNILEGNGGNSTVQLFCDKCGKLIVNEFSKTNFNEELKRTGNKDSMKKFGYWYCDACKKPNSLCVLCEKPMKKLVMCVLACGHEGHFQCLRDWFLNEGMNECPAGDIQVI
ncbi:hypothetical protein Kpol_1038p20 [Vanderwaltozyma polyspora DSM 70294]|uniref:Restriction of telomere capping protein 1 n=1 Tax=Vanderwaltozyma polyspora (strain ATCC 22028 / DSM 70294 / BCRC 21397 / CBS 2163 / NBRC 10782 / NRRL Y-8283 / UCD 57-17) TaxID=436907 RepID=RTC1_VANPO|nr:uncharacterized protein Kpol_1038p20 [Vanderwaltozyma polyspora DSM 70294]A7TR10.1 RecName: Full=Restriction of telomere capping protein 1 [Vanderwaltozyma polyspora DSM 70294]EDO15313.1 hypothetical protein Kpol_1038p20 [Vanderwaltozyma polyspora DSM 70294]